FDGTTGMNRPIDPLRRPPGAPGIAPPGDASAAARQVDEIHPAILVHVERQQAVAVDAAIFDRKVAEPVGGPVRRVVPHVARDDVESTVTVDVDNGYRAGWCVADRD